MTGETAERTRRSGAFRQHFARDARDRLIRQSVVMADDRTDRAREYTPDARSLLSRHHRYRHRGVAFQP
jgi:hypothetical protein